VSPTHRTDKRMMPGAAVDTHAGRVRARLLEQVWRAARMGVASGLLTADALHDEIDVALRALAEDRAVAADEREHERERERVQQERAKLYEEVAERAKAIDPATFSAYWTYGSIADPYNTGWEGEDNVGRVWWIYDNTGPAVTAWDFLSAHPEVDWNSIYARAVDQ
jgi:hypothetical protein